MAIEPTRPLVLAQRVSAIPTAAAASGRLLPVSRRPRSLLHRRRRRRGPYYVCDIEEGAGSADKNIRMHCVPNSPDRCPIDIDETAEAHIMGRLSPAEALHFENHCTTCRTCAAAAKQAEWFVGALRGAAQRLSAESPAIECEWSQASLTLITPIIPGGVCAQMRFYVTGYAPPRRR